MMRFDEVPYVSDREAFAWARIIEPADPRLARRIRRAVWGRRLAGGIAVVLIGLGFWFTLFGAALWATKGEGGW